MSSNSRNVKSATLSANMSSNSRNVKMAFLTTRCQYQGVDLLKGGRSATWSACICEMADLLSLSP